MRPGVTLQINLAPTDLPHARWILPHQLRCWAGQVSAVVLTVALHRSRNRYAAEWRERLPGLRTLIEEICSQHAEISSHDVDYSPAARMRVADMFFGGVIPGRVVEGPPPAWGTPQPRAPQPPCPPPHPPPPPAARFCQTESGVR